MEEELYTIEIVKDNNNYIARVRGSFGDREYSSPTSRTFLNSSSSNLETNSIHTERRKKDGKRC